MEIIHEINGIKYLLVEDFTTKDKVDKMIEKCKKYNVIVQSQVLEIKSTFFSEKIILKLKLLIPFENINSWNHINLNE